MAISHEAITLPEVEGGFRCIAADIPWGQAVRGGKKSAGKHNPVMTVKELSRIPVAQAAAKDAWLFLWGHWTHLPEAIELMASWGFTYSSNFSLWAPLKVKEAGSLMIDARDSFHVGRGRTTLKTTVPFLLGRRGSPKRLSAGIQELVVAPWRDFGRKPDEVYDRVEAFCEGPRLELFARADRDGWYTAGTMTTALNNRWKGVF